MEYRSTRRRGVPEVSFAENYFSPGILAYHIEIYYLFLKEENYSLDLRRIEHANEA